MSSFDRPFNEKHDLLKVGLDLGFVPLSQLAAQFFQKSRDLGLVEGSVAPWIDELKALCVSQFVPTARGQTCQALAGIEDLLLRLP